MPLWEHEPKEWRCIEAALSSLKSAIQCLNVATAVGKKSTSLKKALFETSMTGGALKWEKLPITSPDCIENLGTPSAIYHLDGKWDCEANCGISHVLLFVVCLNNRETIGTNLLKLEIACRSMSRESANSVGVLITLQRDLLDYGGWDPAYADSYEYRQACRKVYSGFLQESLISLEITSA